MYLKREVTTMGILMASVSAIIGSGWLFGSLYAAQMAGPAAILSWIIGGAAVTLVALCFAEIATMFPISGGLGSIPLFTHGNTVSFIISWTSWIAFILITPIEIQAIIQYTANYIPSLIMNNQLTTRGIIAATILLIFITTINAISTKFMTKTSFWITLWKVAVPIIAIVCFFASGTTHWSHMNQIGGFAPFGVHGVFSSLAVGGIVLAFNGFQPGIALAGETKNPQKSIPIAVIGSIVLCTVIYGLLQLSFLTALPSENLKNGWAHLSFIGDAGPLAGLAVTLGLILLAKLLYVDALISPVGSAVVFFAAASRSSYSMSRSGHLPVFLSKLSSKGIPIWGVALNFIISFLIFIVFHSWQEMAAFYGAAICLCNAVIPLTLMALRKSDPMRKRSFKLPAFKILSFTAFYISNMMLFWCGWNTIYKLDIVVIVGFLFIIFYNFYRNKTNSAQKNSLNLKASSYLLAYLVLFSIMSKLGTFDGGNGLIKVGPDFVFAGIISIIIFVLSRNFIICKQDSIILINKLTKKQAA